MRAGVLDQVITLQSRGTTKDAMGGQGAIWTTIGTRQASYRELSGNELLAAQQIHAEIVSEFGLRYDPTITTKMRVKWAGRTFDIRKANDPDGSQQETILKVSEGLTSG